VGHPHLAPLRRPGHPFPEHIEKGAGPASISLRPASNMLGCGLPKGIHAMLSIGDPIVRDARPDDIAPIHEFGETTSNRTTHIEHFAANTRAAAFYEREGFTVRSIESSPTGRSELDVVWRACEIWLTARGPTARCSLSARSTASTG
jgi:hypothetical protein